MKLPDHALADCRKHSGADELEKRNAELLAALKLLTAQASIAGNYCFKERGFADLHAAITSASAAIAKAERITP